MRREMQMQQLQAERERLATHKMVTDAVAALNQVQQQQAQERLTPTYGRPQRPRETQAPKLIKKERIHIEKASNIWNLNQRTATNKRF